MILLPTVALFGAIAFVGVRKATHAGYGLKNEKRVDGYAARKPIDSSAFNYVTDRITPWPEAASLPAISNQWQDFPRLEMTALDAAKSDSANSDQECMRLLTKSILLNYLGKPKDSYAVLTQARTLVESDPKLAADNLYTLIHLQGLAGLRLGESENCVECRGVSACILPIRRSAIHLKKSGSELAVQHFTEYLDRFPDDLEGKWLLNIAHMTLGQYPSDVNPRYLVSLDGWSKSEFDIGEFEDIGHRIGLDKINQAGGAILDDFTNDGLLDAVVSTMDPTDSLAFYRNTGDGMFRRDTESSVLKTQLGGLNCVQTDYNNDGLLDIFVPRGAWLNSPVRPSLLKNIGQGRFSDVTQAAGLQAGNNSNAAQWADFDNDGLLDVFVCCEKQPNRLYRNLGDGTFRDVAAVAGLLETEEGFCKGAIWLDYDNDTYPDLFVNYLDGKSHLFRNDGAGRFKDVTREMGIDGPLNGFSCWAFDYDNDGWLDIFATCYERTVTDIVKGLLGQPHAMKSNRLFRNLGGKRFEDVTKPAGLDLVFSTMGSNFGDFNNDGFLDMYLSTGDPSFGTLVPNRMFLSVNGERFADITASSRTGHLQKGHGVACGDWDRDGNVDLFVQLGGAVPGDRYHNVMFQNPGHDSDWITLKLVGKTSNRAGIGARIKITTEDGSRTIYRTVCSGSSFGANPLTQCIGLGKGSRKVGVEVFWPSTGSTQTFTDVRTRQAYEVAEFGSTPRPLNWKRVPAPKPAL